MKNGALCPAPRYVVPVEDSVTFEDVRSEEMRADANMEMDAEDSVPLFDAGGLLSAGSLPSMGGIADAGMANLLEFASSSAPGAVNVKVLKGKEKADDGGKDKDKDGQAHT